MKKMTRLVLIGAVLATSGLTAKIATENYKAVVTNDERIHKAYELAKKPNKAAVLEAIVDAANAEPDERIRDAVVIDPDEPKVVRVKTKVTTSAGVSPISPTMDKKTVNKAEEFIEKVAHPAKVVMEDILEFSPDNIPDVIIPVQSLRYETKDIFPTFEEMEEEEKLTYKITLPEIPSLDHKGYRPGKHYCFNVGKNDGSKLNGIVCNVAFYHISAFIIDGIGPRNYYASIKYQSWDAFLDVVWPVNWDPETRTIDYSALVPLKDSNERIKGQVNSVYVAVPSCKEVYDFLVGVEKGKYPMLTGLIMH